MAFIITKFDQKGMVSTSTLDNTDLERILISSKFISLSLDYKGFCFGFSLKKIKLCI